MKVMTLRVEIEKWPRAAPLRITGYTFDAVNVVVVSLEKDGSVGRGEAAGVYYHGESADTLLRQIESLRPAVEAGITRESLQQILSPGGARNALDCALWDLEAKLRDRPVWQLAGMDEPRPLCTTFTCGANEPTHVAATALAFKDARAIKLKLAGEPVDRERVRAVREALPNVWLCIDANQGFSRASLAQLMPVLTECDVKLIEQPFPLGQDAWLDGFDSMIPIAADESAQSLSDVPHLLGRFNMVNIKLDKCGGLTEGLEMARAARRLGLDVMVGSMGGTSLATAPAYLVGQLASVVDLDGPALLKQDRPDGVQYVDGCIHASPTLWGGPRK